MLHRIVKLKDDWYIRVPYYFKKNDLIHCRFDPMTIAIAAIVGGTGLSTYSTLQEGKQAAEQGKIQQQQYEMEAKATEMAGLEEGHLMQEQMRKNIASQITAVNASGGKISGSNLMVLTENARNMEMDRLTMFRNVGIKITELQNAGKIARYQGQLARVSSRYGTFGNILGTAGQVGMMYSMYKAPTSKTPTSSPSWGSKFGFGKSNYKPLVSAPDIKSFGKAKIWQ